MINIGKKRHRITIQRSTPTLNSYGEPVDSWSTLATPWAEQIDQPGREYFKADQRISEAMIIFRIRYRTDLTTKMRVSFNGELYDIKALPVYGNREAIDIVALKQGV